MHTAQTTISRLIILAIMLLGISMTANALSETKVTELESDISSVDLSGLKKYPEDRPTAIADRRAKRMLLGKHLFTLQWINFESDAGSYGSAVVTERNGILWISGEHRGKRGNYANDYATIEGKITYVGEKEFMFVGDITTKVHHLANGRICKRSGEYTFKITKNRKYWRMQEMKNPCDDVVDYIDVYFKK